MKLQEIKIIDVRTPGEYSGGNVSGSINIPLNEIPDRLGEFNHGSGPIFVCCASGKRSSQAEHYLRKAGINEVYDGGAWSDLNVLLNN